MNHDLIRSQTLHWLERFVIDMRLCPFAAAPYRAGLLHLHISQAHTLNAALDDLLDQADALLELPASQRSTTLIIYPNLFQDFAEMLDAISAAEDLFEQTQADAFLQLAHFHPDYLFDGEAPDDPSHHTNRAPYPTLHLLRTEEVAEAIAAMPDIHDLPDRNAAHMRTLGHDAIQALYHAILSSHKNA